MRRFLLTYLAFILVALTLSATDRALLVGIGKYDRLKTGWSEIHGDNDVELLKPRLAQNGFTDIVSLSNEQATKNAIVSALTSLAKRCREGDRVFFLFSGHGQPVRDDNHDEGKNKKYDESIIPYDACRDSRKMNGTYAGQFHLIDDELCPLLDAVKKRLGTTGEFFVAVDACFSKGIQKDEMTEEDPESLHYIRGTDIAFTPPGRISVKSPKEFTTGAKMTVVTACQSNERNYEFKDSSGKWYGSLSYYLSLLIDRNPDFNHWRKCFADKEYAGKGIFKVFQHPSIEVFE